MLAAAELFTHLTLEKGNTRLVLWLVLEVASFGKNLNLYRRLRIVGSGQIFIQLHRLKTDRTLQYSTFICPIIASSSVESVSQMASVISVISVRNVLKIREGFAAPQVKLGDGAAHGQAHAVMGSSRSQ